MSPGSRPHYHASPCLGTRRLHSTACRASGIHRSRRYLDVINLVSCAYHLSCFGTRQAPRQFSPTGMRRGSFHQTSAIQGTLHERLERAIPPLGAQSNQVTLRPKTAGRSARPAPLAPIPDEPPGPPECHNVRESLFEGLRLESDCLAEIPDQRHNQMLLRPKTACRSARPAPRAAISDEPTGPPECQRVLDGISV